jgi:hypothetical protein
MRTQDEIQRAHDLLNAILNGEGPRISREETYDNMSAVFTALCWALGHDAPPGRMLAEILAKTEEQMTAKGYKLEAIHTTTE